MWQIDGEEDCVLTWGDLIDMSVIDELQMSSLTSPQMCI